MLRDKRYGAIGKAVPRVEESPTGPVPYQGKAIGEIPNVATSAAIANAIADAVGVRFFDLPITAEKLYWALKLKKEHDGAVQQ